MEFNIQKATKAEIATQFAALTEQRDKALLQAQNAVALANFFGANLEAIEKLLLKAPFINQSGKFFKTIFWVVTNFNALKSLIEEIVSTIKLWREKVEELRKQNAPQ